VKRGDDAGTTVSAARARLPRLVRWRVAVWTATMFGKRPVRVGRTVTVIVAR
jgi:hypothetical protein